MAIVDNINSSCVDMKKFNEHLFKYLRNEDAPLYKDVIEHLSNSIGKQIRSKLSLLSAKLEGELNFKSYQAAMAVEIIHTSSLLHDDIVDNANERRGHPSVNTKWGNKVALFSSNVMNMKAILLNLNEENIEILKAYTRIIEPLVNAEILQLKKTNKLNTNESTYYDIIHAKTALLFGASCEAGFRSTSKNVSKALKTREIGENIGMAFQIKDDLFAYEDNNSGKPDHNDFYERKLTLPLIYTINTTSWLTKRKLIRLIKSNHLNDDKIFSIKETVKSHGGIKYAKEKMQEFSQKALNTLQEFSPSPARDEITKIISFSMNRNF